MNESDHAGRSARRPIAATVFYLLSVLLFPVTLTGYVLWVGTAFLAGRTPGVSRTAQGPLSARWFMHHLGVRRDEPAQRLLLVLPGVSPVGVRLVAGPLRDCHINRLARGEWRQRT